MKTENRGYKILAINPGSTSTKIALYENEQPTLELVLRHKVDEVAKFSNAIAQSDWRRDLILEALKNEGVDIKELSAIIGRGGLVHPIPGGVYEVNEKMCHDLIHAEKEHVCNLGALIASEVAQTIGARAFIADPPVVDEMIDEAKITGLPECSRRSIFHALNHKATARVHCRTKGLKYEEVNLIVAHLGSGISIAAHAQGKIIDVNNALDGDGPFAADRAGSIPSSELVKVCYSGLYTEEQMLTKLRSQGGLMAYLGSNSLMDIIEKINEGDPKSKQILTAMCYQIIKQIGSMATAMKGKVDAIVLTGGMAYCDFVVDYIREHCSFISEIDIYPGENELQSLAMNAYLVLKGDLQAQIYE